MSQVVTSRGARLLLATSVLAVLLWACSDSDPLFEDLDATITGQVFIDGAPAADAIVTVRQANGVEIAEVVTDSEGRFSVPVSSGVRTVELDLDHDADLFEELECTAPVVEVEIAGGETQSVIFDCLDKTPFTLAAEAGFSHDTGIAGQSIECKRISTQPPRPGGTFSVIVEGPIDRDPPGDGVVPGQPPFEGTLDENGEAYVPVFIRRLGTYRNTIIATSRGGVVQLIVKDVMVNTGPSPIPCQ